MNPEPSALLRRFRFNLLSKDGMRLNTSPIQVAATDIAAAKRAVLAELKDDKDAVEVIM